MSLGQISSEEAQALKESLKRCPPGTYEAAIAYRETGDSQHIVPVVLGIIERYVEPEIRPKLQTGDDSLNLIEDLGVDSLTMMEIVILVEETLEVSFDNSELREVRTVADIKRFMEAKIAKEANPSSAHLFKSDEIDAVMPQQSPFLFLQEAVIDGDEARGTYKIQGHEFFLKGHFKDKPVFPASIMIEALGQLGVFFLLKGESPTLSRDVNPDSIYFTSCDGVRCHRICTPGETLQMIIRPKRIRRPLATFEGTILVGNEKTAYAEEITLIFDYVTKGSDTTPPHGFQADGKNLNGHASIQEESPSLDHPHPVHRQS
ncbi:MAG: phosphopantetheine-binding protein [Opitutales bacterium]